MKIGKILNFRQKSKEYKILMGFLAIFIKMTIITYTKFQVHIGNNLVKAQKLISRGGNHPTLPLTWTIYPTLVTNFALK